MKTPPKICIFVACHKQSFIPDNPVLYPVQVGAALTDKRLSGMQPDNEGDNISDKNPYYCELTAQYWAWKNADCDHYGFFHYRRYLAFDKICEVERDGRLQEKHMIPYVDADNVWGDLSKYRLNAEYMHEVILRYDILTVCRERINTSVYRQFCQYHSSETIDRVLELIRIRHPEYAAAADRYMSSHEVYYMNMYIMRRDIFDEYMNWLFDILGAYEDDHTSAGTDSERCCRDRGQSDNRTCMEPRIMGFLAERLFGIFYTYKLQQGAKCAELRYIKFYNTDPDAVQTSGDIRTFAAGPLKIKIDMRRLNKLCPAGSRRRMLLRGLFVR